MNSMSWIDHALNEIKGHRIPHRNFQRALSDAMAALLASSPGEIVVITGPSRVGKSRLASELGKLLVGSSDRFAEGIMPVVSVQATNCGVDGSFSSKSFTLRALEAVKHPFYGVGEAGDAWEIDKYRLLERTTESAFRTAFERALVHRKTLYLFIDEAHHIRYCRGGDTDAAAILDSWKCLASETKIVLVLIGAYPLVHVLRLSTHLLGRKNQVHFPRYLPSQEDLLAFEQILDAYTKLVRLPPSASSLRDWNELLYTDTFGCIGLLEGWLRRGLSIAMSEGADTLSKDHLIRARQPLADRQEIAREIANGETALEADEDVTVETVPNKRENVESKRTRKPFRKKPRRYAVGGRSGGL